MNKFIKKMKYFRKGAITIEFIIVVSILVLIAGFGTTFIYNQFSGAKDKMNKVGDVMLNGDISNSGGSDTDLNEEVETVNITEADTDWQVELISGTENYRIKEYNGSDAIVTVPSSYKGCPIVGIGDSALYDCSSLTSITIPSSVTSIGGGAFWGCGGLTSITIPSSVTSIGGGAFWGCGGLTSITIPSSVTSIGNGAFEECSGLTSIVVDFDNGVYDSRNNCNAIIETATNTLIAGCKNTIIPNDVTKIEARVFCNCTGLSSIMIPASVIEIQKYYGSNIAFNGCSGLETITVDVNNKVYDSRNNCNAIIETATNTLIVGCKNTIIPNDVTKIGEHAFDGCSGLASIAMPSGVTSIEDYAFDGCSSLTNITIPDSVTSIRYGAFEECSSLTSITIPSSVTSIGGGAFQGCSSLTNITIPDSITSIGNFMFSECTSLTSITIPSGVTNMGYGVFEDCSSLTGITINATTPPEVSADIFEDTNANLKIYVPASSVETYKNDSVWSKYADKIYAK